MVACNISKQPSCKGQTSDAVLHDTMAAHFHEHIFTSSFYHLRQECIERNGIGSRMFRWNRHTVNIVAHRGKQTHFMSHVAEHFIQHSGNSCFSICARHTHQLHLARRGAIESSCHLPHHLLGVFHPHISHLLVCVLWNRLAQNGYSTFLQRFVNVVMSISHCSPHGDEKMSISHLARIYLHTTNVPLHIALDLKDIEPVYESLQFHHFLYY